MADPVCMFRTIGSIESGEGYTLWGEMTGEVLGYGEDEAVYYRLKILELSKWAYIFGATTLGKYGRGEEIELPENKDRYFNASLFLPSVPQTRYLLKQGYDVDLSYLGDSYGNPAMSPLRIAQDLDRARFEKGAWRLQAYKLVAENVKDMRTLHKKDIEFAKHVRFLVNQFDGKDARHRPERERKKKTGRFGMPEWINRRFGRGEAEFPEEEGSPYEEAESTIPSGSGMLGKVMGKYEEEE